MRITETSCWISHPDFSALYSRFARGRDDDVCISGERARRENVCR